MILGKLSGHGVRGKKQETEGRSKWFIFTVAENYHRNLHDLYW